MNKYFIIDFDSTFITLESLDELSKISLKKTPEKIAEIEQITKDGMVGKIGFRQSLESRIKKLGARIKDIEEVTKILKKNITPSILRNKKFFKQNAERIYIISGGFEEMIWPVVEAFGILRDHILANKFISKNGKVLGFDKSRPTSQAQGKAEAVSALNLEGEIIVLGDGFTDLEIKRLNNESGIMNQAKYKFIAFTENVYRDSIVNQADFLARDFDEFLFLENIPSGVSYPKSRMKVLLLENIEAAAFENFTKEGYEIEFLKSALDEGELSKKIKDVSILGIRSKSKVTKSVLKNARKLKCIGAFSIGTDQIDLDAASEFGVAVFNAPFQNTRSVVELAIGEIIMLMRGVFDKSNKAHEGIWDKSAEGSNEIRGKTLGIIGYGSIGSQLSVIAESLGMEVLFYDKIERLALGNAKKAYSLDEVLKKSDVISVHVTGDKKLNTNLISDKEFARMKNGVVFLNLARGFIVDVSALVRNLKSGKIRGAGIDVFPYEPKGKEEAFFSELQNLPNVILTPHIAGSTKEAQKNIAQYVCGKLIEFMNSGDSELCVNLPNISLPRQGRAHRLLHLHKQSLPLRGKNEPGVISSINKIFAKEKVNVLAQFLKTEGEIGYVITDINHSRVPKMLKKLKEVRGTISLRVLF